MTQAAFRIMILLGSALMVYNISRWFGFAKKMRWIDRSTRVHRALADPALSSIPIVAMTANVFGEDLEREREAGMTAHISKPLHVEQMLGTLAEVLG
jgi:hypothetical protein